MRLLLIFVLMFYCSAWGDISIQSVADKYKDNRGGDLSVIYWTGSEGVGGWS